MAIIYTYPEINQVEGEDLLLISDTSLYKRPTRSVTIDNLAAYIGTVIGIGFWNLGTAPDSIFTTKMASVGQDANIASSKLNVYKTDDMTASVPHIATFNESLSNHSLNLWPSPGDNAADIYGSVSRGTFTGSGTVDQIIGSNPIGRHSGSGSVNFIQGTQAAASLTGSGSVKTIVASYAKTFIEGTGNNNIANAFGAWNVAELNGLNDVDNIYGTYSNVVLKNGDVNDNAVGHFIDFDQVSANTDINNAYYIHAINDTLTVNGEKFFIKDETGIPSQFSNKLILNAYGSGAFTGTATQRLAVDTNGNVIEIPIGSGPVDGSGTANYTARWIDTDTLGIGALYDNGTNVGIGTTSPQRELDVNGGVRVRGPLDLFQSNDNTFAGEDAGNWYNVLGNKNAAFGKNSQEAQVNGSGNTSAGYDSMAAAILGNFNTAIGESAMSLNNGGSFNTAIGSGALKDQTAGQGNTAIGFDSLNNKEASNFNTAVGYKSLFNISTGFKNIGIGDDVGLALSTGARNILIGSNANVLNNNDNNSIVIGESAVGVGSNTTVIGNNSMSKAILYGNVGIGTTSPSQKLTVLGIGSFGTSTSQTLVDYDGLNAVGNTDYIRFKVDNSEKLRITSAGNVGIGVTSPATVGGTAKLTVNVGSGTSSPVSIVNGTTDGMYIRRYAVNGQYQIQTTSGSGNSGNLSLQSYGGNVGIGTTSPSRPLSVYRSTAGSAANFLHYTDATAFAGLYIDVDNVNNIVELNASGDTASTMAFQTGNAERMRITTTGNVGIGTTNPGGNLHVVGRAGQAGQIYLSDIDNGSGTGDALLISKSGNNAFVYNRDSGSLSFGSNNTSNYLNITSSGNVGIGTTSPANKLDVVGISRFTHSSSTSYRGAIETVTDNAYPTWEIGWVHTRTTSSTYGTIARFNNQTGTSIGGIVYSGSSGTSFVTTSDYRLKENIKEIRDSISRVKKLKPCRFNFAAEKNRIIDGFIAHEVQEVVPEAVHGEKDALQKDGSIDAQTLEVSRLIPVLTKALQEAINKIEELELRIQTIENN